MTKCEHLKDANPKVQAHTQGCEECEKTGQQWVALRKCLICGHVGCCDSSPGRHATEHFNQTGHTVMQAHDGGRLEVVLYPQSLHVKPV